MKKSLVIFAIITIICTLSFNVYAASFSDVNGHWAESYINRWSDEKVVNGYEDNTFRPNNNITRAEFVTMIMRIFEPTKKADISSYTDVSKSAWYYDSLAKSVAMGAMKGDSATSMRPDAYITRQEAIVILNRILNIANSKNEADFSDANEIASWAKNAIIAFTEKEYVNGYEDGTIKPTAYITRAEIAKILDKSISKIISDDGEIDLSGMTGNLVIKAENVMLKNDTGIEKVFVLNGKVKNTLKTSKNDVIVINADSSETNTTDNKDSQGGGGTGGETTTKTFKIVLTSNGDKYDVKKEGTVADGARASLVVDGKTIVDNKTFSKDEFEDLKYDLVPILNNSVKKNEISAEKLVRTLSLYKGDDAANEIMNQFLGSLDEEDRALIEEFLGDDVDAYELLKTMSDEELIDLAFIFLDVDYNTVKATLETL